MLLLLPASHSMLLMQWHWQGPHEVVEKVVEVDYHIRVPRQGVRLYHINLLKVWQEPEEMGWDQAEIDWDEEGRERS